MPVFDVPHRASQATGLGVLNEPDIYREWAPPEAWRAVACCWEQRVGAERTQRVVPDGHADLLLHDSGEIDIVGLHDTVALPRLPAGTRIRGIRFRAAAVAQAFGVDASALRNETVPADAVLGSRTARLLQDPAWVDAWLRTIEPDARVDRALQLLGSRPVAATAEAMGITERHLRRLLLERTGLPPKSIQRVQRFQRFVRSTDAGCRLAAAAADAGYSDQPHLSREVVALAGVTPAVLVAERTRG